MLIQLFSNTPAIIARYEVEKTPLVLLQDGVYAAKTIIEDYSNFIVYAIEDDFCASGQKPSSGITLISIDEWVKLCAQHPPVLSINE